MIYAMADLGNAAAQLQQAYAERDAEKIADWYAPDVIALYPEPYQSLGRQAVQQLWSRLFAAPDFSHPTTVDEIVQSEQGDLGYTLGRWWLLQPSTGLRQAGRYVAVWQPRQGTWEITHLAANAYGEMASADPPAEGH